MLQAIATKDLFAELVRRRRIRILSIDGHFYNELSEDEKYMEHMDDDLVRKLGVALNNKLFVMLTDRVVARDADERPMQTVRTASLAVIIPDGADPDGGN